MTSEIIANADISVRSGAAAASGGSLRLTLTMMALVMVMVMVLTMTWRVAFFSFANNKMLMIFKFNLLENCVVGSWELLVAKCVSKRLRIEGYNFQETSFNLIKPKRNKPRSGRLLSIVERE